MSVAGDVVAALLAWSPPGSNEPRRRIAEQVICSIRQLSVSREVKFDHAIERIISATTSLPKLRRLASECEPALDRGAFNERLVSERYRRV